MSANKVALLVLACFLVFVGLRMVLPTIYDAVTPKLVIPKVCDDAYDQNFDFSNSRENHFSVNLRPCFGGWVRVPIWWDTWRTQPKSPSNYWMAIWFDGEHEPSGPYFTNDLLNFKAPVHQPFRVEGHGTTIFYTNQPARPVDN
jgi:hypothetical protein